MQFSSGTRELGSIKATDRSTANHGNLHACKQKGTLNPQSALEENIELLGAKDGVLCGFGDAELYHALGGNLNGLALIWTEWHRHLARRAIDQHQFTESGNCKRILCLFVSQLGNGVECLDCLLF